MPDSHAKTSEADPQGFACSLWVDAQGDGTPPLTIRHRAQTCSVGAFGGAASISYAARYTVNGTGATITDGTDSADTRGAAEAWWATYGSGWVGGVGFVWELRVSAPGAVSDSTWVAAGYVWRDHPPTPGYDYEWAGGTEITGDFTCTVTGLTLCRQRVDASGVTRQYPMDFTDQTADDSWYADDDAQVTVSGESLTATGTYDEAGSVVDVSDVDTFTCSVNMIAVSFPAANQSVVKVTALTVFGEDAALQATVYNPGSGDAPWSGQPDWKRAAPSSGDYLKVVADGAMGLQRSAAVTYSVGTTYSATIARGGPLTLNWKGDYTRRFDPDGASPTGLKVTSNARSWVDGAWETDEWDAGSDYTKTEFWRSELFDYEWDFLSGDCTVTVTQASRETQGEDVGDADPTQNDARAALLCQSLTDGITGEPHWGPFLSLTHLASLNVNDPPGATSRPSLWTAGGGVTVDGTNNDLWTVAAGSAAPYVTRALASLYPLRMARLAGGYTPGLEYNPDWPYILRRARSGETATTFGDDPDWWTAVQREDVWNWSNFSYLQIGLDAPKAGTVTVTLTVQVPILSDPCYTSAQDRWDEFAFSETERTFTYSFDVIAGANTVQVDLCLPESGIVPEGEFRLCRVQTVRVDLPAGGASPEQWELTDLSVVEDTENTSRVLFHNKRAWDWRSVCWFGFGATVDGKPSLQVDPGYRKLREEWGLQYIQFRQHDPDSELTDELHYAKSSERLAIELDWQEGWECTWEDPVADARNTDADDIAFAPELYWWDHQHQEQSSDLGCVTVGTLSPAHGCEYDVYYSVFPRGKVHGLLVSSGQRARETGAAWLYKATDAVGTYERVGSYTTDIQGRFVSDPLLEKGWYYGLATSDLGATCAYSDLAVSGLQVANRSYTFSSIGFALATGAQIGMTKNPVGLGKYAVAVTSGSIIVYRQDTLTTWSALPTVDSTGNYDAVAIEHDGSVLSVLARRTSTQALYQWYSYDEGDTWTGPTAL